MMDRRIIALDPEIFSMGVLFEIKPINCKCISLVCSEFFNTTYLNGSKKVLIDYILFVNITLILSETYAFQNCSHFTVRRST